MPRSIWTGSLSFGLVNVPVRVYSAIHEHDVRFHQLAPDGSRIHYRRVSEKTGREIDYDDIRKGYELSKGKHVVLETDELSALTPRTTKTIDIEDFVALEEIDPIYYERTYFLAPADAGAAKAYALLATVMSERQRVGIGKVVMRQKQYLAAVRPYGKGLAMSTMRFADEVVAPSDIDSIPTRRPTAGKREKQMAGQLLDSLERDWDPKRYHDDYEEQVRDLIKAKSKGRKVEAPEAEEPAPVLDLLEALQASLEGDGRAGKRSPASNTRAGRSPSAAKARAKKSGRGKKPARRSARSHATPRRRAS